MYYETKNSVMYNKDCKIELQKKKKKSKFNMIIFSMLLRAVTKLPYKPKGQVVCWWNIHSTKDAKEFTWIFPYYSSELLPPKGSHLFTSIYLHNPG